MHPQLQIALDCVGKAASEITPLEMPPRICGVYFLLRWGKIVYIGQSIDVIARVRTHIDERNYGFDSAVYLPVEEWKLNEVEQRLIYQIRPEYNRSVVSPAEFVPWVEDSQIQELATAAVCGRDGGITHAEILQLVWKELKYHISSRALTRILENEKRIRWDGALAVYVQSCSDAVRTLN